MFGPFNGPLPKGRYAIRNGTVALTLTNVVNNSIVNTATYDDSNEFQMWDFEYGTKGYKVKNVLSGTYLTYSPWAVPSRIINSSAGFIVGAANTPCEWRLVQTSLNFQPRTMQMRVIAGNNLLETEDYSLLNNGWTCLTPTTTSTTGWTIRTLGRPGDLGTNSLNLTAGAKLVIRSVQQPQLALDVFQTGSNPNGLVLMRQVSKEDAQTWTCLKGGKGFRLKNVMVEDNLGFASVPNTPTTANSAVCQDDKATEWIADLSASGNGYELRLASDPKLCLTIWNADAGENAWVYLSEGNAKGNAYTN
ncbi:hypothetical protein FRB94_011433 [Tulasnella sp. JGI-2019a]|nr:hypothetical protein FRB94_011433 [Tulasnella sp. JGI-2019a]